VSRNPDEFLLPFAYFAVSKRSRAGVVSGSSFLLEGVVSVALKNLAQVAEDLRSNERWLADQVRNGTFPAHKIGRRWVFTDEDIAAILQICSVNASSDAHPDPGVKSQSSMTPTTRRRLNRSSQRR
jgi:hypothetical protein